MGAANGDRPLDRRTFALGVANGVLFNGASRLVDGTVVLSVLAVRLVGSDTLVGLLLMAVNIGWMWPSLFMPYLLEGQGRRMPWYRASAVVRIGSAWALAWVLFSSLPQSRPQLAFTLVALLLFIQTSFGGVGWIPFMDVVARAVPTTKRGRMWGLRQGLGGLLGVGAASLVAYLLSDHRGFAFPQGYAYLFAIAAVVQTVAIAAFCFAREPQAESRPRRLTFRMHMWRGPRILRKDATYRAFAFSRMSIGLSMMGVGFLAVCGQKYFGLTEGQTGTWLLPITIAGMTYPLLWGWVSDRFGSRTLVRITGVLVLAAAALPLIALLQLRVLGSVPVRYANVLLAAAAVTGSAATSSNMIASSTFVLEVAPDSQRDGYLGLHNTLAIPVALSPVLAGFIGEHFSYGALYGLCLVFAGAALGITYTVLPEPRAERRVPSREERLSMLDSLRARMWPRQDRHA